ncbi:hypothetical protein ACFXJO_05780 [Streptomyces lavendulae]|uniref:hypothetical protein n=1 Tax=Streptomyces lavendulae TaxID=1914 RepID=UPI00369D2737
MTSKPLPEHGTLSRRKHHGCKCWDCCEALRAYSNARYAAITAGTWQPYVDAEPVRLHILQLQEAGISLTRITQLTNLPLRTIRGFLRPSLDRSNIRPRKRSTRREVADKILAIPADKQAAAIVDAIGTKRRIQALAAIGWPQERVAAHAGLGAKYMSQLLKRDHVHCRTAAAVTRLYDEVSSSKAEQHGIGKTSANRARARARANGWVPPKYWAKFPDAIDCPHFTPEYGMTKAELLAEEADFLVTEAGLSRAQAALRLGKDKSYIDRVLGPTDLRKAA